VEFLSSFIFGFIMMWIALSIDFSKPTQSKLKETMVEVANVYQNSDKICKEIKNYSFHQIKNGNYEYMEVIDTIKRQNNDKTRT